MKQQPKLNYTVTSNEFGKKSFPLARNIFLTNNIIDRKIERGKLLQYKPFIDENDFRQLDAIIHRC